MQGFSSFNVTFAIQYSKQCFSPLLDCLINSSIALFSPQMYAQWLGQKKISILHRINQGEYVILLSKKIYNYKRSFILCCSNYTQECIILSNKHPMIIIFYFLILCTGNFDYRANFRLPVFGGFTSFEDRRIQKTQYFHGVWVFVSQLVCQFVSQSVDTISFEQIVVKTSFRF